jgi:hypothetical protein
MDKPCDCKHGKERHTKEPYSGIVFCEDCPFQRCIASPYTYEQHRRYKDMTRGNI